MNRFIGAMLAMSIVSGSGGSARADDHDAKAVLDKAIKAIGGEAKLGKAKAFAWKAKGKSIGWGNESPYNIELIVQDLDHFRVEVQVENDGALVNSVTVVNGDEGWQKVGDKTVAFDGDRLANRKRNMYLLVVPVTLISLKGKPFQIDLAGEEHVDDRPAIGLKVTGPDGKDFTLSFDKESGLPIKLLAKVMVVQGREFTQETTFGDYKDFEGIKKAIKIETKSNGKKDLEQEVTEFQVLDRVAPETFAKPQ
jgi:hypothetical protein